MPLPETQNYDHTFISQSTSKKIYIQWSILQYNSTVAFKQFGEYLSTKAYNVPYESDDKEFCIHAYPKGRNEKDRNNLSIFIVFNYKTTLVVTGNVRPHIGKIPGVQRYFVNYPLSEAEPLSVYGIENFLSQQDLVTIKDGSDVHLSIEIDFTHDGRHEVVTNDLKSSMEVHSFGRLYNRSEYSDVSFQLGKDKVKAHTQIIAQIAPKLYELMLTAGFDNTCENTVEIGNVKSNLLEELLFFIYHGSCPKINDLAEEMLPIAVILELNHLKKECEIALIRKLSPENVFKLLIFSYDNNCKFLKNKALEFLKKNKKIITAEVLESFKPNILRDIIQYAL